MFEKRFKKINVNYLSKKSKINIKSMKNILIMSMRSVLSTKLYSDLSSRVKSIGRKEGNE